LSDGGFRAELEFRHAEDSQMTFTAASGNVCEFFVITTGVDFGTHEERTAIGCSWRADPTAQDMKEADEWFMSHSEGKSAGSVRVADARSYLSEAMSFVATGEMPLRAETPVRHETDQTE
jgi:hypothetical protein